MDLYTSFTQKKREVFHHPRELLQEDDTKAAEVPEVPKVDAADAPKTDELKAGVDIRPAPVQVGRFFPMICWVFGTSPGGCLEFLPSTV